MPAAVISPLRLKPTATVWDYLALADDDLERADLVAVNLAVARGLEPLKDLDVEHYTRVVGQWTAEFARRLPASEHFFWQTGPENWKNDIRFYRVGMLQGFLGSVVGIRYHEEERHATAVHYTDAGSLFLNSLIDSKIGRCANMATLHVAMARRMGWPVSLALVKNHQLSRFDDGEVVYNIEASHANADGFSEGSDELYAERFKLPPKAKRRGADLRKLTAREMIGLFVAGRARHYQDIGDFEACDTDCSLARHLLPTHRALYLLSTIPYVERGATLFDPHETGHPKQLYEDLKIVHGRNDFPTALPPKPITPLPPLQTLFGGLPIRFVKSPPPQKEKPVIRTMTVTPIVLTNSGQIPQKG